MFDSALVYLTKAIQLKPGYKTTYSNRALTHMSLKNYNEAIKDWQSYLQLDPDAADVVNTIGLCQRMLGKYNEALVQINKAIQMDPQGPFFMNRSYTYVGLRNIEMAKQDALTARQKGVQLEASYAASLGIQ
jgi:tetratricopeptide (TPR) repeat protein